MAWFWEDVDPTTRDLFHGVGGAALMPDPDAEYEIIETDRRGYSTTYDVRDPAGREWSVKIGDEAQSEVSASRIVWAVGYRQLPSYHLPRWKWRERDRTGTYGSARFRPKVAAYDVDGSWSWHRNPYVGTPAYRGLLVLMMVLNSTDLKDANNALVRPGGRREPTRVRYYVVKDLGATFGETGIHNPARNDVEAFEEHPFLRGVADDGHVRFVFRGGHRELIRDLRVADVRWLCARLGRLTDRQWGDVFRAAGQTPDVASRFVAKLKEKIREGRALPAAAGERPSS